MKWGKISLEPASTMGHHLCRSERLFTKNINFLSVLDPK